MNPLSKNLETGTLGELLVQLRLLQYGVQAVATHKDTGNDLLAVRGEAFCAVQVKTTRRDVGYIEVDLPALVGTKFHLIALVLIAGEGVEVHCDQTDVFLLEKAQVTKRRYSREELGEWRLNQQRVDALFAVRV